jgi:hypothetical protein
MYHTRNKNKIQYPYTFKDMYDAYLEKHVDTIDSPYFVTYLEYVDICSSYYKEISKYVIEEGGILKLPFNLGTLSVCKQLPKQLDLIHLSRNWELSEKYQKPIFHLNEHSEGYKYKFLWSKKNAKFRFDSYYQLKMTRTNKRNLARVIKNKLCDFFEL